MRHIMANAPVGDDVLGDDPTVKRLEAVAAERAGKEAAIFTPSGSMANLIAITLLTRKGDEVLQEVGSHPFNYEAAGASAVAGVQIRPLQGERGILAVDTVGAAIRPPDDHFAPATLLTLEDTSNRGGGTVYPLERIDALAALAHERGLRVHLDGARVFNAVVASGIPLDRRARDADTVSFCFSKGLGAPVGSVLCGDRDAMVTARRIRKMLGGGMRQSGILAAAALHALEHHVDRLADDHARAQRLAEGLNALGLATDPCDTNLLYAHVPDAPAVAAALRDHDVHCLAVAPGTLRLVTHLDVDDAGIAATLVAFEAVLG
ncbi:MAG: aminotransferase class I/II-fold pyridoxal phosphate-dependent enzyme [Alphaproteobacteria bacterium]|nr:aminotransferase class I/II-fold pyridoxal phosphate-dependent enzyme [Alphaproteobacteria bacterium]MCB9692280.1 aminotransferase class I/II-fold pyridoxal phosphate-dependent enzyme [Alphaproteobacteria bacterium]